MSGVRTVVTDRRQFYALYATRFVGGFGFVTLVTLLPTYVDRFDPSGLVIGLFTAGLTISQTLAVVPLAWAGDRYDKRLVLLCSLGLTAVVYGAFLAVESAAGFVLARGLQGVAITGTGLMSLALVGGLAPANARARLIGTANAWRFAAGIVGTLSAGLLYELVGLDAVFVVLVAVSLVAALAVWRYLPPDRTRTEGFAFTNLALNDRILTLTGFRAQYAIAVTLVRTWVPIYAGVSAAKGGLAYSAIAVSAVITAEKLANMLAQPRTGTLSDRLGRARFVFVGGGFYGAVALCVPFTPQVGTALGLSGTTPLLGVLSPAFLPLVACNALLGFADSLREPASMALFADEGAADGGVASSFGIRELVWRPGSILAPLLGGTLMTTVGMQWVFYIGAFAAFSASATFLGLLSRTHGRGALAEW